jgi:pimeloyl-ACP methyl ester carboxylesterase
VCLQVRCWAGTRAVVRCLGIFLLAWVTSAPLQAGEVVRQTFVLRGEKQYFFHIPAQEPVQRRPPILFVTGDRGWCGAAVDMGQMIAKLGYEVYGFDVRRYLSGFTASSGALTEGQVASDMEQVIAVVASLDHQPVVLVGWSQGAAMVVLTAARTGHKEMVGGVLTIALPEAGFLGWRRRDDLLALLRRGAHEPQFQVAPLLPQVAPIPTWMVYGTKDRFTPAAAARRLVSLARRPRRRREIQGGDHPLKGHREQLSVALRSGLAWVEWRDSRQRASSGRSAAP